MTSSPTRHHNVQHVSYPRPPLIPTNLNTPPTSPDLPSSGSGPFVSSSITAEFTPFIPPGGNLQWRDGQKLDATGGGRGSPTAVERSGQERVRRLRNVRSYPVLGMRSSSGNGGAGGGARALGIGGTIHIDHDDAGKQLRRKQSGILVSRANPLEEQQHTARRSGWRLASSSSVPEGMSGIVGDVDGGQGGDRKRRRTLVTPQASGDANKSIHASSMRDHRKRISDVFTSGEPAQPGLGSRLVQSVPPLGTKTAAFKPEGTSTTCSEEDSDEDPAPLDPKIVFSKERFLRRHSRDFGHLYGPTSAPATVGVFGRPIRDSGVGSLETETQREERLLEEERRLGREKRRSWMLAKAGLTADDSVAAAADGGRGHKRISSVVVGGYEVHSRRSSEVAEGGDNSTTRSRRLLFRQSIDLRSPPVLAGGPRPLSLVASLDLKKRLSAMGVNSPAMTTIPVDMVVTEEPEELLSTGTSAAFALQRSETPRRSVDSDQPSRPRIGIGRPGHARNQSSLSIPYAATSRRSTTPTTRPPSAYSPGQQQLLVASPAQSMQSTPPRSPLPPHLRNFSTSSTSTSLSSLGALIGGSPGASSSSCSSGGDHLGGPRDLAPEAFNFRMSVVEPRSSLRGSMDGSNLRPESRMTLSSMGSNLQSLRTDSRMTLRGATPGSDSNRDSVIDDKHERARRRRARAFLVAGLKLEQGSLARSSTISIDREFEEEEDEVEGESDVERSPNQTSGRQTRRVGLVMEQADQLAALADIQESASVSAKSSVRSMSAAGGAGRKRYSMLRREKMAAYVRPTSVDEPRQPPARAQTPLLPLFLQPTRSVVSPTGTDAEQSSAVASFHTARESLSLASPRSSGGLPPLSDAAMTCVREPFTSDATDASMPVSASAATPLKQTLRRVRRFDELGGPAQDSSSGVVLAATEPNGGPGITISLFESTTDQETATISTGSCDDHSLGSTVSESQEGGLKPPEESPAMTSTEESTPGWGRGINSEELARELFWQSGEVSSPPSQADTTSIRKVKSDAGLGTAFTQQSIPPTPSTPISPSFIPADSAGASPGREQKESWSKGVRTWLTGGVKTTKEGEMEKGFGDGRGGDVRKTPITPQTWEAERSADQILKEKRSWRPFSVGRRRRRGSLPESFSLGQISSMAPSAQAAAAAVTLPQAVGPTRCSTEPGTPTPTLNELMQQQQSTTSPTLLSPPAFPLASFSPRTNEVYSPSSAGSFSPATPELLSTTSPGMRVEDTPCQPQWPSMLRSPNILSPTPHYSQHPAALRAKGASRPCITAAGLVLTDGTMMGSSKSPTTSLLPTINSPCADATPTERRPSLLHGLGLQLPWKEGKIDLKGKGKGKATDESPRSAQVVALPEAAHIRRRPAPITVQIRPPTGYESSFNAAPPEPLRSAGLLNPSIYSTLTRVPSGEAGSDLMQGDTLVGVDPRVRHALMKNVNKSRASLGDYRAGLSDTDSVYSDITLAARGEVLPAKLLFMLGFLLGPWVWLIGGWGLSPAGCFFSSSPRLPMNLLLRRHPAHPIAGTLMDPNPVPATPRKTGMQLIPPLDRDHPDKWVKRNRWAAVVSSAVFIPAMCVGFAFVGAHV